MAVYQRVHLLIRHLPLTVDGRERTDHLIEIEQLQCVAPDTLTHCRVFLMSEHLYPVVQCLLGMPGPFCQARQFSHQLEIIGSLRQQLRPELPGTLDGTGCQTEAEIGIECPMIIGLQAQPVLNEGLGKIEALRRLCSVHTFGKPIQRLLLGIQLTKMLCQQLRGLRGVVCSAQGIECLTQVLDTLLRIRLRRGQLQVDLRSATLVIVRQAPQSGLAQPVRASRGITLGKCLVGRHGHIQTTDLQRVTRRALQHGVIQVSDVQRPQLLDQLRTLRLADTVRIGLSPEDIQHHHIERGNGQKAALQLFEVLAGTLEVTDLNQLIDQSQPQLVILGVCLDQQFGIADGHSVRRRICGRKEYILALVGQGQQRNHEERDKHDHPWVEQARLALTFTGCR